MELPTCVAPNGKFIYATHHPRFVVRNLRQTDARDCLGTALEDEKINNDANFPPGDVHEEGNEVIFEIPNPLSFRGSTFILKRWADERARDPMQIGIAKSPSVSFSDCLRRWSDKGTVDQDRIDRFLSLLPEPFQLTLAVSSTDPVELVRLAELICDFEHDPQGGHPTGMRYRKNKNGEYEPVVRNQVLFEALANNVYLPDSYKTVMVLKPGVQGKSEIVGDWTDATSGSRVYEYLRRNSYIPWGHYAANMADTSVRYRIEDLTLDDIRAMRHLYYQRTFVQLAAELGLPSPQPRRRLSQEALEAMRMRVQQALAQLPAGDGFTYAATLWGWNFGYDYAPSRYRLHASHQQVHQQYALVPYKVAAFQDGVPLQGRLPGFGCGEMVRAFVAEYRRQSGVGFFDAYEKAIRGNQRLDGRSGPENSLIVYEDGQVMLFVPKAQTSQWELQLMPCAPVGNVLEADTGVRRSLDKAMHVAMRVLGALGAAMITTIEFPKRFSGGAPDQRLLYSFLPRLPESPGAFSEAQFRWINGHYPEDFASVCRAHLPEPIDRPAKLLQS